MVMSEHKVGIITFFNAHNYGAVLQAYALSKKLDQLGYDNEFILDPNNSVGKQYQLLPNPKDYSLIQYSKEVAKFLLDAKRKFARHKGFNEFIESKLQSSTLKSNHQFSNVVIGSDQVWNYNITQGLSDFYFGAYESMHSQNTISYAASMGNGMDEGLPTEQLTTYLNKLDSIGVREPSLSSFIKDRCKLDSEINLDPTLIIDKCDWDELCLNNGHTGDYVLVYQVVEHNAMQEVVEKIKSETQLDVKVIGSKTSHKISSDVITTASPQEFLTLFKYAKMVLTTSFHGTVFSIINEKPFYTLKFNNAVDARSEALLHSVGLADRHVEDTGVIDVVQIELDYSEANRKLAALKRASEIYLTSNLC